MTFQNIDNFSAWTFSFRIKNTSATFQRHTDKIFSNVYCVFTCIDNVLIFSDDKISHKNDRDTVFKIFHKDNLKISTLKSIYNITSLLNQQVIS